MTSDGSRSDRVHLYLSSNLWDGLWIIQQPVANEISRAEHVLYVERFVSVFTVLRYPALWWRLFAWLRGPRKLSPTLRILAPLPLFHLGHRFPWLFKLEFAVQRGWIALWANRDRGTRVLWMDNPLYECAIGRFGDAVSIYHVADEISAFPTSRRAVTQNLERRMLERVDIVFAAAEQLTTDKKRWQPNSHTVWNAIDTSVFDATLPAGKVDRLDTIPKPRVAFIGVIDEWVDLELLWVAANRLRHIHFVLVGPAKMSLERLRAVPNVHILGRVDRAVVPSVLRQCSASLVPFYKTMLTARIVPLKVFEALAAGIMPICTDFSVDLDTLERQGHVRVGRSPDEFITQIEEAVGADTPAQRADLASYGRQQTWQTRWAQMSGILSSFVRRQRHGGL